MVDQSLDRAGALAAGFDDGIIGSDAFPSQAIISVDQHDIVVHDDARIRDDPDPGHDHAESLPHDQKAKQHAEGREHHRSEHKANRSELVELRQEDCKDQKDCGAERLEQKCRSLAALLVLTLELEVDARPEIRLAELARYVLLYLGALHAPGNI